MKWLEVWTKRIKSKKSEHEKAGWGTAGGQMYSFEIVKMMLNLKGDELLVDLGCGTGLFAAYLRDFYSGLWITGIDAVKEAVDAAEKRNLLNCTFIQASVGKGQGELPTRIRGLHSAVTSLGLFQNFDGDIFVAIGEANSLLKLNGVFVFTVLNADFGGDYHVPFSVDGKPCRRMSVDRIRKLMDSIGFRDVFVGSFSKLKGELSLDVAKYHELIVRGRRT